MPFSYEFLQNLREREARDVLPHFPAGCALLEIGGGAGYQAKFFADQGLNVTSIDVPQSNYTEARIFNVLDYDGSNIPADDQSFDVVYSSNVLEHVQDLAQLNKEILRVLKPNGYAVHVLPSPSWRFWTSVTTLITLLGLGIVYAWRAMPKQIVRSELTRIKHVMAEYYARAKQALTPTPHGERGNAISELYYFSRYWWIESFKSSKMRVEKVEPMGLFYTGNMLLGAKLSFAFRAMLARFFGSATTLFIVRRA